ncbi:hypothetical protein ASD11_04210 [Aeromicrobium sp. Root495]|uniref:DUF3515 family protein n=1 Tax=Aeromicrobium sp. Root495 TaxID=1736550 RepID=UPI0006F8AB4D|nr:DUF3515 family protein [Aeromicrobium sp. Root495]KQY58843.1 hypothetical protein ASD11_04210 [Aeromicrobium sp. Root495]
MPRRQPLTLRPRGALAALLLILCAACSQVHVDAYPTVASSSSTERCEELLHDLPGDLDGLDLQLVEDTLAGAWGDPPVILRCGVEPVAESLPCRTFAGETWREDTTADGLLLTSLERPARVSLEVPTGYSAKRLVADLQPTLDKHIRVIGEPDPAPGCAR